MTRIHDRIASARRIVIKIGSALLFDPVRGEARKGWMRALARDVAILRTQGAQVVLISSGSIALGRRHLGLTAQSIRLEEKQAAAATGQVELAQLWSEALAEEGVRAGQILLAPDDTETRRRHINARATITTLLDLGVVPVVNENDTVTTYEIRFGDNDRLAARVAAMISADLLILLSDVDGLYTENPHRSETAQHIADIPEITSEILAMGGDANAEFASGGMATKLSAARIASGAGVGMIICKGVDPQPISGLMADAKCSFFHPQTTLIKARKSWIAGALDPKGTITVDAGAQSALRQGKSLLPVGITAIAGQFDRGDLVVIVCESGQELGHGLAGYSSAEATKLKGQKSTDFAGILGYECRAELIHADDLVLHHDQSDGHDKQPNTEQNNGGV